MELTTEDILKYGKQKEIEFLLEIYQPSFYKVVLTPSDRNEIDIKLDKSMEIIKNILMKSKKVPDVDWQSNKWITFYMPEYFFWELRDLLKTINLWEIFSSSLADKLEKLIKGEY